MSGCINRKLLDLKVNVSIFAARSTRAKHQNPDEDEDEGESGDEDSFINDDSEDVGEDSDYVPPDSEDSEQEDIQRLQTEASAFLKKRK